VKISDHYATNCGKEVLIPFSGVGRWRANVFSKAFANWICIRCGFYIGTSISGAVNIPKDVEVKIIPEIVQKIKRATEKN